MRAVAIFGSFPSTTLLQLLNAVYQSELSTVLKLVHNLEPCFNKKKKKHFPRFQAHLTYYIYNNYNFIQIA